MRKARMWLVVAMLLVGWAAGCDRQGGQAVPPGQAIDPAMVMSAGQLLREHRAVLFLFPYSDADSQGWPADSTEQRVVRIIQDSGIAVAFSNGSDGQRYVSMGVKDGAKMAGMRANLAKAGLKLSPTLQQRLGLSSGPTTLP